MSKKDFWHMGIAGLLFFVGYMLFLTTLMGLTISNPAINKSKDAILEYPKAKEYKANGEKELYRQLKTVGVTRDHVTAATIVYGVARGEISTKYFKNLRYRRDNFELKPSAEYMVYQKSASCALNLNWGF
jgi:hypothetical protein